VASKTRGPTAGQRRTRGPVEAKQGKENEREATEPVPRPLVQMGRRPSLVCNSAAGAVDTAIYDASPTMPGVVVRSRRGITQIC